MSSSAWRKRRALKTRAAFVRSKRRIVVEAIEVRPPAEDPDNMREDSPTLLVQSEEALSEVSLAFRSASPPTEEPSEPPTPLEEPFEPSSSEDKQLHQNLDDWAVSLERYDKIMLSLWLVECFRREFSQGVMSATKKVANLIHVGERTVRWRSDFMTNHGQLSEDSRGKYERVSILNDEEFRKHATSWARANACVKGKLNMTVADFCQYVNDQLLPSLTLSPGFPRRISLETARKVLYDLGFERVDSGKKGVYIDEHERNDVVIARRAFLEKLRKLESEHLPPPDASDVSPGEQLVKLENPAASKHLVVVCRDESTFQSNDDQTSAWLQEDQQVIRPKSRGSGQMVSDFVDEYCGFFRLTDVKFQTAKQSQPTIKQKAKVILEYGERRDGY
ncbi:uncharacterized protein LOC134178536 [Corticium candelabrum]|uniref:uncharacterized protein LOC134178536 n=1 Tax=Corticium candelabrum TaxID=121492 RepID=UPI002E261729|nr:uncharacterized protein LOC134178536 [Corticium candelabrum]